MSQAGTAEDGAHGEAVDLLLSKEHVDVAGHADADGVASAALICMALEANDVGFTFTSVERPGEVVDIDVDPFGIGAFRDEDRRADPHGIHCILNGLERISFGTVPWTSGIIVVDIEYA